MQSLHQTNFPISDDPKLSISVIQQTCIHKIKDKENFSKKKNLKFKENFREFYSKGKGEKKII